MGHLGSVVVSNGFGRIRWLYSIIDEFGMHISVGNKYGVHNGTKLSIFDRLRG